ncbi:alpha/beta hydrolase [Alteromonadaceae bacterium BrNp21-10]|nr:alpha/beta hydrolase [Alteromonadaceae bacterium BrNp21-10]
MSESLPVVFLPGTLCDERVWLPVWQRLDIADRRYVPLQWAETLEQMTGLTEHAVEDEKVHLIGFSLGGYIAALYALANPQNIASLTLIGFNPRGLPEKEMQQRQDLIKRLQLGKVKPMNTARLNQFIDAQHPQADTIRQQIQEMEQDLGNAVLKYQLQAASERGDMIAALNGCTFPINIVAAEHDKIAPSQALHQAQQKISASQWWPISQSGHMMPLEQPQVLADLLQQIIQG